MAKKKKSAPKKRTPAKKKTPAKRKPTKRVPTRRTPTKRKSTEKPKKKGGIVSRVIGKIPSSYKIKGGKSKTKTKHGTVETSYEDLEIET